MGPSLLARPASAAAWAACAGRGPGRACLDSIEAPVHPIEALVHPLEPAVHFVPKAAELIDDGGRDLDQGFLNSLKLPFVGLRVLVELPVAVVEALVNVLELAVERRRGVVDVPELAVDVVEALG